MCVLLVKKVGGTGTRDSTRLLQCGQTIADAVKQINFEIIEKRILKITECVPIMYFDNSTLPFFSFLTLNLLVDQCQEAAEVDHLNRWVLLLKEINIPECTMMKDSNAIRCTTYYVLTAKMASSDAQYRQMMNNLFEKSTCPKSQQKCLSCLQRLL